MEGSVYSFRLAAPHRETTGLTRDYCCTPPEAVPYLSRASFKGSLAWAHQSELHARGRESSEQGLEGSMGTCLPSSPTARAHRSRKPWGHTPTMVKRSWSSSMVTHLPLIETCSYAAASYRCCSDTRAFMLDSDSVAKQKKLVPQGRFPHPVLAPTCG